MPFVLIHRDTREVAAAWLRNTYDLDYYGAEWWATGEEAAKATAERAGWEPVRIAEMKLKVLNVKLNNDAGRKLFMDDNGTIRVEKGSAG